MGRANTAKGRVLSMAPTICDHGPAMERLIETEQDLMTGIAQSARHLSPPGPMRWSLSGPLPLAAAPEGLRSCSGRFTGPAGFSTRAMPPLWARLQDAGLTDAEEVRAERPDERLRAARAEPPETRYARALAEAGIDYAACRRAPTGTVDRHLEPGVPGIGPWTAEI